MTRRKVGAPKIGGVPEGLVMRWTRNLVPLVLTATAISCDPVGDDVQQIHPQSSSAAHEKSEASEGHGVGARPDGAAPSLLEPLFTQAKEDPSVVPELIEEGSASVRSDHAVALGDRLEPNLKRVFFSGETFKGGEVDSRSPSRPRPT